MLVRYVLTEGNEHLERKGQQKEGLTEVCLSSGPSVGQGKR